MIANLHNLLKSEITLFTLKYIRHLQGLVLNVKIMEKKIQ